MIIHKLKNPTPRITLFVGWSVCDKISAASYCRGPSGLDVRPQRGPRLLVILYYYVLPNIIIYKLKYYLRKLQAPHHTYCSTTVPLRSKLYQLISSFFLAAFKVFNWNNFPSPGNLGLGHPLPHLLYRYYGNTMSEPLNRAHIVIKVNFFGADFFKTLFRSLSMLPWRTKPRKMSVFLWSIQL